ncbi:MAG: PAS domain-containing sensor histidine kinase [Cyanophyceae cyanobacterium]
MPDQQRAAKAQSSGANLSRRETAGNNWHTGGSSGVPAHLDEQFYPERTQQPEHAPDVELEAPDSTARLAKIGAKATTIVHEMRSPLTTILLGLSACQKLTLPEAAKDRLALALEEAERLQRLVDEILLYARPLVLQRHELELNKLIRDTLNLVLTLPVASERNMRFVSPSTAVWVKGDRDKLKQVFINLASNACEAISPGEDVSWRIDINAAQAWVSISNGGQPIAPELLPHITEPFLTTKPDGNGLGLAIAQQIVEAHGGRLELRSSAQGTRVSVGFPIVRKIV